MFFTNSHHSTDNLDLFTPQTAKQWGITIISFPEQAQLLTHQAEHRFPAASTIKLPIVVELYRQAVEEGLDLLAVQSVDEACRVNGSGILTSLSPKVQMTYADLAVLSMTLSDNTATNLLLRAVSPAQVNQTMARLGLQETQLFLDRIDPDRLERPESLALTTAHDMSLLLLQLATKQILTPDACDEILGMMKRGINKFRIGGELPLRPDIRVHHKTGTLPGVCNDVGIVYFAQGGYVICALNKDLDVIDDPRKPNEADQTIAQISRWAFEQLDPIGGSHHE